MLETRRNPISSTERSRLENYLRAKTQLKPKTAPSIPPRNASQRVPLTPVQEQIWVHAQMAPELPLYNEPVTIHYTGPFNRAAFQRAFNEIIRRHESWRTCFTVRDGQPTQVVHANLNIDIPFIDLSVLPESEREQEAVRIATADAVVPIDLTSVPLFRAKLIRITEETHRLYLTLSHIIFDGVAIYRVFLPELATLYKAFVAGAAPPLPELPFQYPDFACWQRSTDGGAKRHADLAYWRQQLAGDLPVLDLPADRPRAAVQSFRGSMYPWILSADLMAGLKALSQTEGVTLFQTLLAAFAVLLKRYSGQDDIPIGSVTSGRDLPGTELLLGYFLNTLVLRLDLSEDPSFRELLVRARNVTLEALAHDSIPLTNIINDLHIRRDSSRNPLFQSMFTLEPPIPGLEPGWQLTQMDVDTGATKYDLYLELDERRNGILARFHYSTDLFDRSTIVRMAEQWTTLLEAAVTCPDNRLHDLTILPVHQRRQLLVDWNSTTEPYPQRTIHDLFEREADNSPDTIAVEFDGQHLTYGELNERSNRLAHYLHALGAGRDTLVGLCMERSLEMIVGLLGILKSGAAYIPLDPAYPKERLQFVISDATPLLFVTQESLRSRFSETRTVAIDRDWPQIAQHSGENLEDAATPRDVAYVIYTSGSTGRPKGVQVEHRNVVNFLKAMQREPGITPKDVLAAVTTISFDIAGLEIYLPLITGARVVLVSSNVSRDGQQLARLLRHANVTIMQATPATWRLLLESGWEGSPQLKVLCGGEAMTATLANQIKRRCRALWNVYGPTETTIWSLTQRVATEARGAIPIGRPIANTKAYIVDRYLQPVPIGVAGEICIAGDGVARGYLNRREITAERFVPNPFEDSPEARLYRTGDIGRYRNDGAVEFLGRTDTQVKLRGFRVELGDIEASLLKHGEIKSAVAEVRELSPEDPRLVAYIVAAANHQMDPAGLKEYLRPKLPEYMIPAHFVFLSELPLTPNGKLNRRALPLPDKAASAIRKPVSPRDETETQLVRIWESILSATGIGIFDDFFDVGGHSILAVRLFAEIEKSLHKTIPLAALLKAPTVAELATIIRGNAKVYRWTSLVPIQVNGSLPPVFCVHGHYGEVLFYRPLAKYLGDKRPFYALQAVATNGRPAHERIEDMAQHYIMELRQARPHGPYYIAGYCFGSLVAFEMAQRLRNDGEEVAFLGMFMGYEPQRAPMARLSTRIRRHVEHLHRDGLKAKLGDIASNVYGKFRSLRWRIIYRLCHNLFPPSSPLFHNIPEMNLEAAKRYRPTFYPGKMTVFLSGDSPTDLKLNPKIDLHGLDAAEIEVRPTHGDQHTMMQDPHVSILARELNDCLNAADTRRRSQSTGIASS